MATVNLSRKNIAVRTHPVLLQKIDAQFLAISSYPKFIAGKLERAQSYLTASSITVVRGDAQNVYYLVCPFVVVLVEHYRQALFDNLDIKASVQDLTDEEVTSRFWMQIGQAFSFMKVCRELNIRQTHAKNQGAGLIISPRPKIKVESFPTHVERLAVDSKPIREDLFGDPLVKPATKLTSKKADASGASNASKVRRKKVANGAVDDEKHQFQLGLS
ncbi:hypothetical protein [Kordiimonas pumila]|uniref:Uncharacterized protein n=1 Tax=Kordiimonas pumila TaxID=2161677 RepID=A0ABV7DAF8_9PROT|nr:hypothetical protein [Kordiimonas pumila]